MPVLRPHVFKIGTRTFKIKLPDVYDTTGYSVGKAFGLKKVTTDQAAENRDAFSLTVSSGLLQGLLVRVRVGYIIGSGPTAKRRSARLVCPISEVSNGISDVLVEKYANVEVATAGIPRRRRLG
jgi:hypothetical protein